MADFLSCGQLGSKQKVAELKKSLSSTPTLKEMKTRLCHSHDSKSFANTTPLLTHNTE